MIGQIIATVFIAWFLIGLMLLLIGSFINGCSRYLTKIDEGGGGSKRWSKSISRYEWYNLRF
jgi:hypothetical protein